MTRARRTGSTAATRPSPGPPLAPLERRRALTILAGLGAFAVGFAVAGVLVTFNQGGSPAYWCLVSLGLLGVGALGISSPRTVADAGRPAVWSRAGLTAVAEPVGLPARLVAVVFYGLVAVGLLGNVLLPVLTRRR